MIDKIEVTVVNINVCAVNINNSPWDGQYHIKLMRSDLSLRHSCVTFGIKREKLPGKAE